MGFLGQFADFGPEFFEFRGYGHPRILTHGKEIPGAEVGTPVILPDSFRAEEELRMDGEGNGGQAVQQGRCRRI
jgi:hypothetical protein